jgi:hypothetical protein
MEITCDICCDGRKTSSESRENHARAALSISQFANLLLFAISAARRSAVVKAFPGHLNLGIGLVFILLGLAGGQFNAQPVFYLELLSIRHEFTVHGLSRLHVHVGWARWSTLR